MPRNVEIKARVGDVETLRERVERMAGHSPDIIRQLDTFFHCDNGRLKLRRFSDTRRRAHLLPTSERERTIGVPIFPLADDGSGRTHRSAVEESRRSGRCQEDEGSLLVRANTHSYRRGGGAGLFHGARSCSRAPTVNNRRHPNCPSHHGDPGNRGRRSSRCGLHQSLRRKNSRTQELQELKNDFVGRHSRPFGFRISCDVEEIPEFLGT